jgi:very-short-patch-repair endonuclease
VETKKITHQQLHKRARDLRNQATPAERKLWLYLSGRKLMGLKFRRQHLIGHSIVDFYCPEKKLIIEVDGGTHIDNLIYDRDREDYLHGKGYVILRFLNAEVVSGTDIVLEKIEQMCKLLPPPTPPP